MSPIKTTYDKNYFENFAYREKPNSQRNHNRLKEIINHKTKGRLLEVGCGTGEFLKLAEDHFYVEGVDVSSYAVKNARRRVGPKVRNINIENQSVPKNHYDVIVAFNLLEHLKKPTTTLKKLHAGLKKTGILVGSVPNNAGPLGIFHTQLTNIFDKTHRNTYAPKRWGKTLKKSGFRNVSLFGEFQLGRNHSTYLKNIFWKQLALNMVFVCQK